MYCVKCGVKLADTEKICPLCNTVVYHPEIKQDDAPSLYPEGRIPRPQTNSKAFCGLILILYLIPTLVCFLADLMRDDEISWFGIALGGLFVGYIMFALPLWFKKPNPVIFIPCDFAAIALYLLYINYATGGNWFLSFALPVTGAVALIVCAMVTLAYYLRRGKLYIFGGGIMAFGALALLIEFLVDITFGIDFIGWSFYPLIALMLIGGALIYLGINRTAREIMERKLFF